MKKMTRNIRLSQGITTYGVGAIVGLGDESFINKDINSWNEKYTIDIELPRLSRRLNVLSFKHPKPKEGFSSKGGTFNFFRFPLWLFCPSCRLMEKISFDRAQELNGKIPTCKSSECMKKSKNKQLVPMRFITACEDGHINDFPWWEWAHSKKKNDINCKDKNNLEFIAKTNKGASYAALEVRCRTCGNSRSLQGSEHKDALKGLGIKCKGIQPWQKLENADNCDCTPQMKQRNASNIYQPTIISAIDIPANYDSTDNEKEQLYTKVRSHEMYQVCEMLKKYGHNYDDTINNICRDLNCLREDVESLLVYIENTSSSSNKKDELGDIKKSLQKEEWEAFFHNINDSKFINEVEYLNPKNKIEQELTSLLSHVSLVKRLREVRAFKGFNRLKFDDKKIIPPYLNMKLNWLPAIEVYGEGIFIALDNDKINKWYKNNKEKIDAKFKVIKKRYEKVYDGRLGPFSVKFILLHTLSHLLIRQLSFESGYSSSSLRENIYCLDEKEFSMSGILIYTADSDSEGSLGGLVRQGEGERLISSMITALNRASWCSSDPVCSESEGQGPNGLNLASCHACSLISETSCSHFNSLLDRSLILDSDFGFFKNVYKEIGSL